MSNALIIDVHDSVAVAIEPLSKGEEVMLRCGESALRIRVQEDIPIYHKLAVRDVAKGDIVLKYGEAIGLATEDIVAGQHVHTHNLVSPSLQGEVTA